MKDRIRLLMEREKMSQKDFADMLGVPPATLSNIFAEKTKPTLPIAMKINDNFPNINLEWLLTGRGNMYKEGSEVASEAVCEAHADNIGMGASLGESGAAMAALAPLFDNGGVSMVQQAQIASMQSAKNFDKNPRRVVEIRVFYDDNTFESFYPKGKA